MELQIVPVPAGNLEDLNRRLSRLQIERILADPSLNKISRGYYRAFSHFSMNPEPRRSGGTFRFTVFADHRKNVFERIANHTKIGDLGIQCSMPTRSSNTDFRMNRGWNTNIFPIFIHTYDAEDMEDKQRILDNLAVLGFHVDMGSYKTSTETDFDRIRFGDD